jgi:hypothetical protein
MAATSIDLSQIKTDALDTKTAFRELIGASGEALPVVTITDAGVSMVANTRYEGSIAAFAADRTYTLPAGTAGDVVEVALTTGDDTYELIIAGASGVSINGGSAATEWSRLFIDNEFVRFRCFATNDWRVEIDGRITVSAIASPSATITLVEATWNTSSDFTSVVQNTGQCYSSGIFTTRRAGRYSVNIGCTLVNNSVSFVGLPNSVFYFQPFVSKNGTVFTGTGSATDRILGTGGPAAVIYPTAFAQAIESLVLNDTLRVNLYQETGANRFVLASPSNVFSVVEML